MCISVFIYINKTVYPRTSDCKLYYIIPVMTLVSDGLVSPYILIWASFFFLFMDGTELERKEARVLWSNSDLFCFPKRNSVYGRVFGKWEVDFFFLKACFWGQICSGWGPALGLEATFTTGPLAGKHKWPIMLWPVAGLLTACKNRNFSANSLQNAGGP